MIEYSTPAAVIAVSVILTLLCVFVVGLRFVAQRHQKTEPKVDDWLCLAAMILTVGMAVGIVAGVAMNALAYPTPALTTPSGKATFQTTEKIEWGVQMIQVLQLGFTKLSFVVLFRRLFVTNQKGVFSITTWVMIGLLSAWTVSFFFSFLFACRGNFAQWWSSPQSCIGLAFENGFALSDTLMDFLIIVMPIPMIWSLHMTLHRKIAITGVFALGTLAVVISIVRLVIFYEAKNAESDKTVDHTLLITLILFWSLIESTIALIAACLPLVYGLVGHRFVDSIVRSVHSLRSLGSGSRSHASTRDQSHGGTAFATTKEEGPRGSDASRVPMVPSYVEPSSVQTSAAKDDSATGAGLADGRIHVSKAISQTEHAV